MFTETRINYQVLQGQDGSYLTELLLSKGYEVHGIVRRVALEDTENRLGRLKPVLPELKLHAASMESFASLYQAVMKSADRTGATTLPHRGFVSYSFDDEFSTLQTNINGATLSSGRG